MKRAEGVSGFSVREAAALGQLPGLAEPVCDGVALEQAACAPALSLRSSEAASACTLLSAK